MVEQYRNEYGIGSNEVAQWDEVLQALRGHLTTPRYFLLTRAHFLGFEEDHALLGVFHDYELRQIESRLSKDSLIAETMEEILGRPVAIQLALLPPPEIAEKSGTS